MTRTDPIPRAVQLTLLVLLAGVLLAVAAATADAGRSAARPYTAKQALPRSGRPYDATLLACRRGGRVDVRSAAVGAAMRPIPNGRRLQLRVDLQQRELGPGGRWSTRHDVPGLGVWASPSDPTIGTRSNDVFVYRQSVGRLVVPYAYRFRVTFRWLDADGRVTREASARTATCREPDLRPNLTLVRVDVKRHRDPTLARYVALVRNAGRTAAARVGIGIAPAGATVAPPARRTIRLLRPHELREVTVVAPRCEPGSEPTLVVDPAATVDESDESDNALRATCPATLQRP